MTRRRSAYVIPLSWVGRRDPVETIAPELRRHHQCRAILRVRMRINFLFRCPHVGLLVQGSVTKSALPPEGASMPYECPACGTMHLVDPRTSEGPQIPQQPRAD